MTCWQEIPQFLVSKKVSEFTRNLGAGIVPKVLDKKIASNGWVGTVGDLWKWENANSKVKNKTSSS
jgi:hypothetical protein